MKKFVFISYKSEDRELVRPYLAMLDEMQVHYWWDDQINRGWSKEIDQKLGESAAVICFLTERAAESGAVFAECETGAKLEKLIPIMLDQAQRPYHFRALLAFLNYVDLSGQSRARIESEKDRLLKKIHSYLGDQPAPRQESADDSVKSNVVMESWVTDPKRLPHIAYIVALCFFEGRHHDLIQVCAALLEEKLKEAGLARLLKLNEYVAVKQAKFKLLGAESVRYRSMGLQHEVEFVRFENHLFGEELLVYLWSELDQLKAPVIEWLDELVEREPSCMGDIAASLSKIGRKNFYSVYANFMDRWLVGSPRKFRCADMTLSLMSADPDVRRYLRDKLFDVNEPAAAPQADGTPDAAVAGIATPPAVADAGPGNGDGASPLITNDIAVQLVTGFTGMAMPDLSIHVFKRLEASLLDTNRDAGDIANSIRQLSRGIHFILAESRRDSYARSVLKMFAARIHAWALESSGSRTSLLPEFVFSILLEGLTVGRGRHGTVSLWGLLAEEGKFEAGIIDAFARGIAGALQSGNAFIRDRYKDVFKTWCENLSLPKPGDILQDSLKADIDNDRAAFTELFKAVFAHASTPNDQERIRFLVKSVCLL